MRADRGQLETAIVNLGTNARDAMPNGGMLTLSAERWKWSVRATHPEGLCPATMCRIDVIDNGTGMDAATLRACGRAVLHHQAAGHGTGLGLAMVKGFAEQSGAACRSPASPGKGTTVVMWLRQADGEARRSTTKKSPMRRFVRRPASLLSMMMNWFAKRWPRNSKPKGSQPSMATSGHEAVALVEAGEIVDALVCDLSMPGING